MDLIYEDTKYQLTAMQTAPGSFLLACNGSMVRIDGYSVCERWRAVSIGSPCWCMRPRTDATETSPHTHTTSNLSPPTKKNIKVEAEIRSLADGGYLVLMGGKSHVAYMKVGRDARTRALPVLSCAVYVLFWWGGVTSLLYVPV